MQYTIKISKKNSKAIALINYLKTLEFVELTENSDWWDDLGEQSKSSIEKGLEDLRNNQTHSDQEVKSSIRNRILNAKKR